MYYYTTRIDSLAENYNELLMIIQCGPSFSCSVVCFSIVTGCMLRTKWPLVSSENDNKKVNKYIYSA